MNSTGVSPSASGAQFGASTTTPEFAAPQSDPGAAFALQAGQQRQRVLPISGEAWGSKRFTAWATAPGEPGTGTNIGSYRTFNDGGPSYEPIEVK